MPRARRRLRRDALGQADRARRPVRVAPPGRKPGAVVRREDLVVGRARRRRPPRRDDEARVDEPQVEHLREPALPLARVRAHVGAQEDGLGADAPHRLHRLRNDLAAANVERGPGLPQRCVEVDERLGEERLTVRRGAITRLADALVEHEERQHRLGLIERGVQRRVVVKPEVAREEDDGRLHRCASASSAATPCMPTSCGTTSSTLSRAHQGMSCLELGPVVDEVPARARGAERVLGARVGRREPHARLCGVGALAVEAPRRPGRRRTRRRARRRP